MLRGLGGATPTTYLQGFTGDEASYGNICISLDGLKLAISRVPGVVHHIDVRWVLRTYLRLGF